IYDNRVSSHCPEPQCAWLAPATPEAPGGAAPAMAMCPAGHAYLKADHWGCPQCRNFYVNAPISFAIAFAVLALPITLAAALLLSALGQPAGAGMVAGAVILPSVASLVVLQRGAAISDAERGLYWLGSVVVAVPAGWSLCDVMGWRMDTIPAIARVGGQLVGCWLVLASVVVIAAWRSTPVIGIEAGLYWLGCSVAGSAILLAITN